MPKKIFNFGSINKRLTLLVLLAVVPAMIILLYSGMEQREQSIEQAKQKMLLITNSMAETQDDISSSVKQVLSTLSLMPEIQSFDIPACKKLIQAVLRQNPDYLNIALTDLNGEVLVSGKTVGGGNLADRKHFQDALKRKGFAIGEFIISRVGTSNSAFAYAYPVLDHNGTPIGVLTTIINLDRFSSFHKIAPLQKNSFVAVTDHKGIRIFYYPPKKDFNPVGKPIKASSWEKASKSIKPGIFVSTGSDGVKRMFAFQPIRFAQDERPYLYVWAGIPEDHILDPANRALTRNLMLMLLAAVLALFIAWLVGKKTLLAPIHNLVSVTRKYTDGNLEARIDHPGTLDELGTLINAFHEMADALTQHQEILRNNEARFRLVMDSLNALVYVADMETYELLFINEYGKKQFGDISGSICWQSLQNGQSGPCSFCTNKYLLDENGNIGGVYTWEFQNTVNGKWFYIQDRAIIWLDGRIVRIEVATDITEKKQAEKSLQQSNEILEKVFSTAHFLMAYMDKEFNFLRVNKAYAEADNQCTDYFAGKNHFDLYPSDENKAIFQQVVDTGEQYTAVGTSFEYPDHPEKGDTYWDWSLHPVFDEDKNVEGILLTLLDVTKAKQAEKEKAALETQLRQAHKMEAVGTLAGGIAHDFNNILAIILGNAELARLNISEDHSACQNIDQILTASNRAKNLIKRLLTFSRQDKGEKEAFHLCHLVVEDMKTIRSTIPKSVKVELNTPSKCRDNIDDCLMIYADPTQFHQLLMNLCANAVAAMDEVGTLIITVDEVTFTDEIPVSRSGIKPGTYEYLSVSDTGHGMRPELVDKIFDPFFTTKEIDKGTGIGLSVVQGIVNTHDGYIFVDSEPDKGTTFHMYFPVTTKIKPVTKFDENIPIPTGDEQILFVDDEEMLVNVGKSVLENLGYTVTTHTESTEALILFQNDPNKFDLVITDQAMPVIQGSELAKQLLQIRPDIPIILCTGYSSKVDKEKARQIGIKEFAFKPLDSREIALLIRKVLDEVE